MQTTTNKKEGGRPRRATRGSEGIYGTPGGSSMSCSSNDYRENKTDGATDSMGHDKNIGLDAERETREGDLPGYALMP